MEHPLPLKKCQTPFDFGPEHSGAARGSQWGQMLGQKLTPWLWIWGTLVKHDPSRNKCSGVENWWFSINRTTKCGETQGQKELQLLQEKCWILSLFQYIIGMFWKIISTYPRASTWDIQGETTTKTNGIDLIAVLQKWFINNTIANNVMLLGKGKKKPPWKI